MSIWVSAGSASKVGNNLRASVTIVKDGVPQSGVTGTIKFANLITSAQTPHGVWIDFTTNASGVATITSPWIVVNGQAYDVKIAALSFAGQTWDNRRVGGFTAVRIQL